MKDRLRWRTLAAAGLVVVIGACVQDDEEVETAPPAAEVTPSSSTGMFTDATIVRLLDVVNQGEIQEAELAQQKAQSQEVRQYAQTVHHDHQQLASQVQTGGAPGTATTPPTDGTGSAGTTPPASGTGTTPPASGTAAPGATGTPQSGSTPPAGTTPGTGYAGSPGYQGGSPDEIIQRIQQESDSARMGLQQLSGAEFDRAYIDRQVMAHQTVLDLIDQQLLQSAQDPQLRQTLETARTSIQSHLDQARQLQQRLGGAGNTAAPGTSANPPR